jgi:hypothetical protein
VNVLHALAKCPRRWLDGLALAALWRLVVLVGQIALLHALAFNLERQADGEGFPLFPPSR